MARGIPMMAGYGTSGSAKLIGQPKIPVLYETISTVKSSGPRVLILATAALVLTNIPLARYGNGQPNYVWPSVSVLVTLWQIWRHGRLAWAFLTVATAVTLLLYGLSIAGVIRTGLPGWWIPITGAANILALAILLSPPIRRWVAKQPLLAL